MRKMVFLPFFLALFVVDYSAFGATNGRRGVVNNNTSSASVPAAPARAATARSAVRGAPTTQNAGAVRSAQKRQVVAPAVGTRPTAARAGTTQKVINLGTKVQAATENTVVSQECQDAYYGCMDAFCMLDNTSGGRCQCSDRNKDLDLVLEEIMKLDEQSLAMATEGVERLQMGENADAIMARVKAATAKVTTPDQKLGYVTPGTTNGKTVRTLDLSAWRSGSLFDEDDGLFDTSAFESMESTLADKTGDALQSAVSKICLERIPTQCKASGSFLQLTYAQKIKSDCTAYENSLKQQRSQSAEKLQTAQKALRDAALEMYQNENKYDFGECVVRFKQCMQTTGECGDDYSGCVADTAILDSLYNRRSGNIATTTIKTGVTSVKISSATYDILNTKKVMCESVTKQCVNANKKDAVWNQVIKDLAPVVYTAEYNAASNNRMNCINTVVKCVQTACGSQWDDQSDNFDACLSDPNSIDNYCKLEYNRCGDTASQGNVKNYIMAKLAAMKVDKCTTDVKECLLSEDRCGSDFAGCIGLDTDSIVDLCPEDKLISCQDRAKGGADAVREYISQIAQGIALNIDNKFATACQNAVEAAFERVCGDDTESGECSGLTLAQNEISGSMKWQYCGKKGSETTETCSDDLVPFSNDDIKNGKVAPKIVGQWNHLNQITFNEAGQCGSTTSNNVEDVYFCVPNYQPWGAFKNALASINADYIKTVNQIASDATVDKCMNGRSVQGISKKTRDTRTDSDTETVGGDNTRFANLMASADSIISDSILSTVRSEYYNELNKLRDSGKGDEMRNAISQKRQQIIVAELSKLLMQGKDLCDLSDEQFATLMTNDELVNQLKASQDETNEKECTDTSNSKYYRDPTFKTTNEDNPGLKEYKKRPTYDSATNVCTVKVWTYECKRRGWIRRNHDKCRAWYKNDDDEHTQVSYETYQMPEWNQVGSDYIKSDCSK